jgi:cytochrome P450 family 142 subfamily A polypeptide 1
MEALLANPAERRKLQTNPGLVPLAVEEMLRWVSPIKSMNRTATRDVELAGARVRAGDKLLLLYPSANRDERVFPQAWEFHVDREPNDTWPSGTACISAQRASLARLAAHHVRDVARAPA